MQMFFFIFFFDNKNQLLRMQMDLKCKSLNKICLEFKIKIKINFVIYFAHNKHHLNLIIKKCQ